MFHDQTSLENMIHYIPHFRDSQYKNPTVNKSAFICLTQCVSNLSWKLFSSENLLTWERNGVLRNTAGQTAIQQRPLSGWITGRKTISKVLRNRLMATKSERLLESHWALYELSHVQTFQHRIKKKHCWSAHQIPKSY